MFKFLMKPKVTLENPVAQPERTAKNRRIIRINLRGFKQNPELFKQNKDELERRSLASSLAARAAREAKVIEKL